MDRKNAGVSSMPEQSLRPVRHDTFVIERGYPAAPERVFAAFSDPVKKRKWFASGEKAFIEEYTLDFRVGGREVTRFRTQAGTCTNNTVYQEIAAHQYIVFAYTMSMDGRCFSSSQATVEFLPKDNGTQLLFTEQGAYFEGADGTAMREEGWSKLLDQLTEKLER
jgi:uncharacterized protein YndB with AHSA1/START domain